MPLKYTQYVSACPYSLSPQEGLADTFRALLPGGSTADFKLVCELKVGLLQFVISLRIA
jgi:hypothetical protein